VQKDCRVGSEIGHIRVLDENTVRVRYFLPCKDLQLPARAFIFAPMEERNDFSPDWFRDETATDIKEMASKYD